MGVDFTPGEAHWSYSGFGRFRARLAEQLRVDLELLYEERPMVPVGDPEGQDYRDPWKPGDDPIYLLLNHSDCDGTLSATECGLIAPRLQQLIEEWPESDYDRQQAEKLIDGMLTAHRLNGRLEFH